MNALVEKEDIKSMIYEVRGKQVMLDSDLARLYEVETKRINEAVKNNPLKFPERFSWRLTNEESKSFLVEIFDQKKETRGGRYKNPRVFTEQGVAMLATILKSKVATEVSINIMDAFVAMRHFIGSNIKRISNLETKVIEHDNRLKLVEDIFDNFKEQNNHIYFRGEIYDAYSLLVDILNKAKKEIIIIDNYINKNLLDILSKVNKKITIITNDYNNTDYTKYKKQYINIKLIINNDFHDRFIIIDRKELYHSGASFKDLGNKCFEISKIIEDNVLELLLSNIKV